MGAKEWVLYSPAPILLPISASFSSRRACSPPRNTTIPRRGPTNASSALRFRPRKTPRGPKTTSTASSSLVSKQKTSAPSAMPRGPHSFAVRPSICVACRHLKPRSRPSCVILHPTTLPLRKSWKPFSNPNASASAGRGTGSMSCVMPTASAACGMHRFCMPRGIATG